MGSPSSQEQLQTRAFKKADDDKYKLYRAGLEWELIDPIIIEDREDMRSESKWKDRIEPFHHQVTNLITFCRRLPVTLLADDVGLGKTISAGLIMSELISRGRISKILVICPKILREQWKEELDTKFGIASEIVTGKELIDAEPPEDVGAVITTYNTARIYLERIKPDSFDMLILDEAHKLRNLFGVDPTPQVALRFKKALSDRLFKYVLMLTATPIQNRLWDLYSLVDLLTAARGHENPFGSAGAFAKKYIADSRENARKLKLEAKDEFRSVVYAYMSRVRRADANLHFPERKVQLHKVDPSPKELELIAIVAKSIKKLNFLAQIVILQALVSSPEALAKLLHGMAEKKTAPKELADEVKAVVKEMKTTTKLTGLSKLIDNLKKEKPDTWRVVIFTRWRETQTRIEAFLEEQKISCGLINGDSNARNQETIAKFKKDIPEVHVIVSTEAGSEGVNLQAANVLVNYDLPWNPMIVEQRIGRIQRLASKHANVSIFNIVLQGTFEEYIVGRLMEKLQMASHAIGDVEALLEAADIDEGDEGSSGFEEKIRKLVVDSLAGMDVDKATRKQEQSIADAKTVLESEEKNINAILGGMGDASEYGPACPKLPQTERSMDIRTFVIAALTELGAKIKEESDGTCVVQLASKKELIRFNNDTLSTKGESVLYAAGTAPFERLVSRITKTALHRVEDGDSEPSSEADKESQAWVEGFGGIYRKTDVQDVTRCFAGQALMRVRATVAHDSYERLVDVKCEPSEHFSFNGREGVDPIGSIIENPSHIGALTEKLIEKAKQDASIVDFCRFYAERRTQEVASAGDDPRKRKKLEDEFTPRIEISLVGLEGKVHRVLKARVSYALGTPDEYKSVVTITPSKSEFEAPELGKCEKTGQMVPVDCLERCEISGQKVLRHLLTRSEISSRMALPEYTIICTLSHKRVLADEVDKSDVTGNLIAKTLLKKSALSGKQAEPECFSVCEFSKTDVLETETAMSDISGKRYRIDQQVKSAVSGKTGHQKEFVICAETGKSLLPAEAEKCEITGKIVMPNILEKCEITGKRVLPSELDKSAVSGKKGLKNFFVVSSVSGARLFEEEAVRSILGTFCLPLESKSCLWSGRKTHPDDLKTCELTGLSIHPEYATAQLPTRLDTLVNLLNQTKRPTDKSELWSSIEKYVSNVHTGGKCKVENAELSPDGKNLAVVLGARTWVGLVNRRVGLVYSLGDRANIGRVAIGKRSENGWVKS